MKLCLTCSKEPAVIHPVYGVMPCQTCSNRRSQNSLPQRPVEFVGADIQQQRAEYGKSIIQPWRGDTLSKEYLELNGTKGIKVTEKDVKNAKYVWGDTYSKNVDLKKSK